MNRNFCSDNSSGVSPEVMQALAQANFGHAASYGSDPLTLEAAELITKDVGRPCNIYFVYNGTAANTLACQAVLKSIDSLICPDSAHIVTHEAGAVTRATGSKIITLPASDGKIQCEQIRKAFENESYWREHATRPKLVSITQSTEWGTVYSLTELAKIRATCDELGLLLHIDGCRIYNAAVALDCTLSEICHFADLLSLGGTKNGLMFGEAVVIFRPTLDDGFLHLRKQSLQLHSKMRFIAAQMQALFTDELWRRNAEQANRMAERLARGLLQHPDITLCCPQQTNLLFVNMPKSLAKYLMGVRNFYPMNAHSYRLVTSFDSNEEEVDELIDAVLRES